MKKSISVGIPDKSLPENIMIAPEIVLMRFHHIGSLEELEGFVEVVLFVLDRCEEERFPVCSRKISNGNIDIVEGGSISVRDGGVGGALAFGVSGIGDGVSFYFIRIKLHEGPLGYF